MALTQMQIIQSLGEAMAWFERELSWEVPPTELRHLCGRIGELYAALITNGQMATEVNQKGYDVVSGDGERISVKTTAKMKNTGHISFNSNTLDVVDRIMILRVNTEEMQVETLLNAPRTEAETLMVPGRNGKLNLALSKLTQAKKSREDISSVKEVEFEGYIIRELETGAIELEQDGTLLSPVKPVLRKLAKILNVGLMNSNGNFLNTRQLGNQVLKTIGEQG
ncbi:MAG: hypothetical protein HUN04_22665 [Desulfobacter sp.]|nr:MAG: hypothetical protein HUN04_22665 [Desulfobacter sp.]